MDNAKEYFTRDLQTFYNEKTINTHPKIPYTPQENTIAERVNRTLMETIRAFLHTTNLPFKLWGFALHAAVDYYNHAPHSAHGQPPIAIWTGVKPDVSTLPPFGQYGYIHNRKPRRKLEPRAQLVQYIGRLDNRHYHVYDAKTDTISRCRAADFQEYDPNKDPIVTIQPHIAPTANNTEQTAATTEFSIPTTLAQARTAPDALEWEKSWNKELDSLESRGTITYIPPSQLPPNTKLLPLKFVLRTKTDEQGNPISRKTRCNLRGDLQRPHEHYDPDNLSSPVADRDAIRLSLALAAMHGYDAHHWDLDSAFLHEPFNDNNTLYTYQPQRFDGSFKYPGYIGKITGNIYGARQACHIFTKGLSRHLRLQNFTQLSSESCTYHLTNPDNTSQFVFCVVTIDDFLVISNNSTLRQHVKQHIQSKYSLKDLGPVRHILGWKVHRDQTGIYISQPAYINKLLTQYNLQTAKPSTTPIASDILGTPEKESKPLDTKTHNYSALIGSLRYLADSTRPDIAFITGYLGRFTHSPTQFHWLAAQRVLKYLSATSNTGIHYQSTPNETLSAYSDSDFAACTTTRRSTSGTFITYNKSPIAWQSKRQKSIATSTWAAEYIAAYHTGQHILCLRNLLQDLKHPETTPTVLRMDNAGAITTAQTEHPTPKSKHIDVKYHYLKELIAREHVTLQYISTELNAADILTKTLKPAQFKNKFQLLRLSQPTDRGDCRMINNTTFCSQREPPQSDDHNELQIRITPNQ